MLRLKNEERRERRRLGKAREMMGLGLEVEVVLIVGSLIAEGSGIPPEAMGDPEAELVLVLEELDRLCC